MDNENKIDQLEKKLNQIEEKIDQLIMKNDQLYTIIVEDLKPNCNKMSTHINFVEGIYDNVKNPLGFICNKINYLRVDNQTYNLENS
tara:strand:+ start:261 stop:521 length:261 start_codon:yes stop_codon:yes gene_type:complete